MRFVKFLDVAMKQAFEAARCTDEGALAAGWRVTYVVPPLAVSRRLARCANPFADSCGERYAGSEPSVPRKGSMFATATEFSNAANIGSSLGESPQKTARTLSEGKEMSRDRKSVV